MAEFATLQHATYTEAEWTAWDGVLLEGQMAYSSDVLYSGTDQMRHKVGNGTDTWTALDYVPEPSGFTGGSLTSAINEAKGADIASAATTDIGAATGNFVHVTGTTTITALGTVQAGTRRIVRFAGALILTHNATSLILPTGANITTAADDVATFVSEGSGNWRCVNYMRASGKSIFDTISQVITNGVTDKAPSEDAVYDALALKVNTTDDRLETIKTIFNHTTTISHTGNTNETYLTGYDITGKFEANDFWMTRWRIAATNNANTKTFRMYVNDTNDLAGTPVLIGTFAPSSNMAGFGVFEREVVFKNSLALQEVNLTTGNLGTDTGSSNNAFSTLTIDFSTGNKFLVISVQLANSADTATLRHGRSNIFR